MDQGPLLGEQIDAGANLAREFDKRFPLHAAFWLKKSEDGEWFLYLVSDQIDDSNFDVAYGEVIRILGRGPHLWLDVFQVKVRGVDDSIAREVLTLQQQYPARTVSRFRNRLLGGESVDEVLIYLNPVQVTG